MKTNKQRLYGLAKAITPPIIFSAYKASPLHRLAKLAFKNLGETSMKWHTVRGGILKGKNLLFSENGSWQKEMIDGTYDSFFFDYLKNEDLKDKTVFEIGAHIGYHALAFAELVGVKGKVFAFEPNPHNAKYVRAITQENTALSPRIEVIEAALSSNDGEEIFISSDKVEEGLSSGGFIGSADTIWEKSTYEEKTGFTRSTVKTLMLDTFIASKKIHPGILKIDVEGAEGRVLEGGREFLAAHSPLILVEIHSTPAMLDVLTLLSSLGYSWELLKKEVDGRCFLAFRKS
ncbi:MAG: FkbM family methyltransferase [bacterium]|nr:FkbM family methyltransferase [bacterium]